MESLQPRLELPGLSGTGVAAGGVHHVTVTRDGHLLVSTRGQIRSVNPYGGTLLQIGPDLTNPAVSWYWQNTGVTNSQNVHDRRGELELGGVPAIGPNGIVFVGERACAVSNLEDCNIPARVFAIRASTGSP